MAGGSKTESQRSLTGLLERVRELATVINVGMSARMNALANGIARDARTIVERVKSSKEARAIRNNLTMASGMPNKIIPAPDGEVELEQFAQALYDLTQPLCAGPAPPDAPDRLVKFADYWTLFCFLPESKQSQDATSAATAQTSTTDRAVVAPMISIHDSPNASIHIGDLSATNARRDPGQRESTPKGKAGCVKQFCKKYWQVILGVAIEVIKWLRGG